MSGPAEFGRAFTAFMFLGLGTIRESQLVTQLIFFPFPNIKIFHCSRTRARKCIHRFCFDWPERRYNGWRSAHKHLHSPHHIGYLPLAHSSTSTHAYPSSLIYQTSPVFRNEAYQHSSSIWSSLVALSLLLQVT